MTRLAGKVVLITGAAERAGRAIAERMAAAGATLLVNHPGQHEAATATVASIRGAGGAAHSLPADITDVAQVSAMVDDAVRLTGGIDVLVHNASSFRPVPFLDVRPADFDASLGVNLRGPFFLSQAVGRHMLDRGGGRIIALLGNSLHEAWPDLIPHALGKAALARLIEQLAVALSPVVQCTAVAPSQFFRSDDGTNDALRQSRGEAPPAGDLFRHHSGARLREADVDAVSELVSWLAVCPPQLTGTILTLDGGRSLA
jgi:NAD(P)-dependent dehydrogenase (short-subunit alcohol dehydrogenase family)